MSPQWHWLERAAQQSCQTWLFAQKAARQPWAGGWDTAGRAVSLLLWGCLLLSPSPALVPGRGCWRAFPSPWPAAGRAGCGQGASPCSAGMMALEGWGFLWLGRDLAAPAKEGSLLRAEPRHFQQLWRSELDLDHLFHSVKQTLVISAQWV